MTYFQLLESLHTEYRRRHAAPMTRPAPSSALFLTLDKAPLREEDDYPPSPTTRAANDNSPVLPGLRRFIG